MKDINLPWTIPASGSSDQDMEPATTGEEKILDNSVIKVIFKEEHFFKKYKSKIEHFFKELLEESGQLVIEHEFEKHDHSFKAQGKKHSDPDTVPFYSSSYDDILHQPEPKLEKKEETKGPQAMTCFNCLGNHHMKDCQEKIDRQRVNANKKDLMLSTSSSRYHIEEKRNAILPGCPSANLRDALSLRDNQLPPYIYAMRVIGYPPGWMIEAEHETSGLSLYNDSLDKSISEINSSKMTREETLYDSERFVSYPGFNSPVPDGFKDEWTTFGWCPIQPHQQLSQALKQTNTISSKNLYKRKFQPSTSSEEIKKSKSGTNEGNNSKLCWSPQSSSTPDKLSIPDFRFSENNCESPISQKSLSSLSKSPGTPIVGHGNPFLRLPSADKFAQDITDHMDFENLPDAVGKYDNMRNVLTNVQKKLQDIKQNIEGDGNKECQS
ncbi:zinc finger CCHC domain-containing protein 8 isoform X1 [Parasteatoda tepidariorum]|uniref:zinc finger CCHC domain-containing protein 8 isoform X1 n=1 Tax=Parasteatoda tepidariorum TaxID=114398 RepID=UPI001C71CABF|nr:zinc finger CCHC domain-containing protein 8 isoform X1 [Parasteatoda tepidariorum]